ncbi:hypothetical protein [Halorussus salinisoli]|uniref:hypothetical protein n=1 Tax=Halorussus salinisoli TaxID=2558242 RepID=UPI001485343B|nr:hypothetical protein [Halorussus salinisoli]
MSNRPEIEIQQQTTFGDDGRLEVVEESVETSLEDFGAFRSYSRIMVAVGFMG